MGRAGAEVRSRVRLCPAWAMWVCTPDSPHSSSKVHRLANLLWEFRWVSIVKGNVSVCFCLHFGKLESQGSPLSLGGTLIAHAIGHGGQSVLTSYLCDNSNGCAHSLNVAGDVGTLVNQPFKRYFLSTHHMQKPYPGVAAKLLSVCPCDLPHGVVTIFSSIFIVRKLG